MRHDAWVSVRRFLLILLLAMGIGAVVILLIGQNPIEAYAALLEGAFVGKLALGTMLANFTPLLLTAMAFAVASKVGAFNVGVEGEVFLGGIVAAWVGINVPGLPPFALVLLCFLAAMVVGALWALIPALLKVYANVSEVCVTILMNYVALYITSYLVSGPMSAGTANAQSDYVQVTLPQFMKPSSVNIGLFIGLAVAICMIWMFRSTVMGYRMNSAGMNPAFSEYAGIDPKKMILRGMMLSGAIGGIAGCIEVLGVHGYFLNNFASGLGSNGMLASLIVKNNMVMVPFMAVFLAILKAGAMGMQQSTGVPKSIVDTITSVFIMVATMETLFLFTKGRKKAMKNIPGEVAK